jgi:hypothetical protein
VSFDVYLRGIADADLQIVAPWDWARYPEPWLHCAAQELAHYRRRKWLRSLPIWRSFGRRRARA